MLYVFSIGLNVGNAEPEDQFARTLGAIVAYLPGARRIAETAGVWGGVRERSLQVLADCDSPDDARFSAAELADMLRQDCIAVIPYREHVPARLQRWLLVSRDTRAVKGATLEEFPVIVSAEGI